VDSHGSNVHGALLRDLAEIAVEARGAEGFRQQTLDHLIRTVGADAGSYSSVGSGPTEYAGALAGIDLPAVEPGRCLREIAPEEIRRAIAPRTLEDSDVLSAARQDRLSLYREFLPRFGVRRYAVRGWRSSDRICFVTIARSGPHDRRRFQAQTSAILDAVFPVIALGAQAHARAREATPGPPTDFRAALTTCEAKVVDLLERGLTNREIAALLGLSVNTVRNRVASAFKRVGASRRAELVYLLRSGS
jgi:DNA-binding NarL/FixJ family response regulator